jgi:hypothetical protein
MNEKVLQIVIKAKNEAEKTLQGLNRTLKDNEQGFKNMATAGTVGLGAIATVVGVSVKAYAESERSQRQLEHAIIQVSKGTKEQVKAVNEITNALQKKAGVDADALNAGVAQLSTFGLQSQSVIDLTKSLADLTINQDGVTAGADSYISSANIMAKALRGEFGMLSKMGIRFTEHQQELINTGTEQQKVATIIEGFNQNLRETTDTVAGYDKSLGQLKGSFGDIVESIGKSLQPALLALANTMLPVIQTVATFTEENPRLVVTILAITAGISALLVALGLLGLAIPAITAGFALLSTPVLAVIGIVAAFTATIYALNESIKILQNDMDLVLGGLKAMFTETFTYIIDNPIASLKRALQSVIDLFLKASGLGLAKKAGEKLSDWFKGKATGGGVQLGQSYMVGEKGPELFTPSSNGSITPNYKMAGAGGVNLTINMNGGTYLDDSVAERIGDKIIQVFKRTARF